MGKRGNEYGHMSKEDYEAALAEEERQMNSNSNPNAEDSNYRASEEVMKQRRIVKTAGYV